jgi:SNF2 family DNA or RNA helicase
MFDPWWNPAVEQQAAGRAHRIGQDKPVFVYKMIAEGTIEDRMLELQARKQALAGGLLDDDGEGFAAFQESDVEALLRPIG